MAHLVVLVSTDRSDVSLGSSAIAALAELGVTAVSVARDDQTVAVVVEGWAFDAARHEAVLGALGVGESGARALQPVARLAVASVSNEGGGIR